MSEVILINQAKLSGFEKISTNVDADKILIAVQEAQELDLRPFLGKAFYDDFVSNFSNASGIASLTQAVKATTAANGNYLNQPLVSTSGTGTGAKATLQVLSGYVSKVTVTAPGAGYNTGDMLSVASLPNAVFSVDRLSTEVVISPTISQPYADLFNGKPYTDAAGHSISYRGIAPALAYWALARFIENASFEYTATGGVTKNHDEATALSQKDVVMIATRKRSMANARANDIEQFLWNSKSSYPLWRYNGRNKNLRQPGARITGIDVTAYNRAGYGYNNLGLDGFINPTDY